MAAIDPFEISALVADFPSYIADYQRRSDAVRNGYRQLLDRRYGDHERNRIDLFFPDDTVTGDSRPIHLFIHGGYWRAQVKEDYVFVAETVVGAGAIAAILEYPLLPGIRPGQQVAAIRQAVTWLIGHAAEFGGDGAAISVSGHSAGAHLGFYLAAQAPHEQRFIAPVRSLLLLSGIYDLRPITKSYLQPELHLTDDEVAQWSPLAATPLPGPQVVLGIAHDEMPPFHQQAQDLDYVYTAERLGRSVERITIPGNHMSVCGDLGRPGSETGRLLLECIERSRP